MQIQNVHHHSINIRQFGSLDCALWIEGKSKNKTHIPLISDEHMFLFQDGFLGKLQVPTFLQNSFLQDLFKSCNNLVVKLIA